MRRESRQRWVGVRANVAIASHTVVFFLFAVTLWPAIMPTAPDDVDLFGKLPDTLYQAVANLGEDLVAVSWSSDGIIEALEDPRRDRFVVAVQWHPELGWREDQLSQRIFKAFVSEAKKNINETSRLASAGS